MKNQFVFSGGVCYSSALKMKSSVKLAVTCAAAVASVAAFVTGVAFGIVHFRNSSGRGGFESEISSNLASGLLSSQEFEDEVDEVLATQEDTPSEYGELSYVSYRVKKGDMIGYIADEFDVTQDTIISVNNIKASRLIQIGQYLKIPSMPGILYTVKSDGETIETIAQKYEVDAQKCAAVNHLPLTEELAAGKSLFVPDAHLDWMTRQEINGDLFVKPLRTRFYYSSMYGWRTSPFDSTRRTFHGGIDMACAKGTPIYAALPGKVEQAGWSDIYGYYVILTHHSGYKTLYGHMSQILVSTGQFVDSNTKIGKVGSTGQSTGPHLHFTVYKNGRTVNPINFW